MRRIFPKDWLITAGILILATLLCRLLTLLGIGRESLLMVYMIGVQCCARSSHGYRYSVACALCSMMLFNSRRPGPVRSFSIREPNDVTLLLFFLMTAVLSAGMTVRLRDALDASRKSEQRAERFHNEKEKALLEAERAHMKSSLLRSIGHDLRTPLTGIQCGANYIAAHAGTLDTEHLHHLAEDISSQTAWLITMVENILYMTRLDNDKLEVDKQEEVVDDVVDEAISHVPAGKERGITINLPPQLATVPMDGRMIVQVLVNLLDNAVKYAPEPCPIALTVVSEDGRTRFIVDDGGKGITPEQRTHIFESFVTSGKIGPDGRKGIGLGLAICRAAVHAHGGEIGVTDSPLGGARFWFWLPNDSSAEKGETNGTQPDGNDR